MKYLGVVIFGFHLSDFYFSPSHSYFVLIPHFGKYQSFIVSKFLREYDHTRILHFICFVEYVKISE